MQFATYAVLFGAGASFGAGDISPHPPLLGSQLYDCLIEAYPSTWGTLVQPDEDAALRDPEIPLEKGMGLIWERNDTRAQLLITDLAVYFTRFEPAGGTDCYACLLRTLGLRNVLSRTSFASLNYDCIFELAAGEQGLSVNYEGTRRARRELPLVKPHGSCNFVMQGLSTNIEMTNVRVSGARAYFESPIEPPSKGDCRAVCSRPFDAPRAQSLRTRQAIADGAHRARAAARSMVRRCSGRRRGDRRRCPSRPGRLTRLGSDCTWSVRSLVHRPASRA